MRRKSLFALIGGSVLMALPARAQLHVATDAALFLADHRVIAGAGLERSSGAMFGVGVSGVPWRTLDARLALRVGSLGAHDRPAVDRDVGEVRASAAWPVRDWLNATGGVTVRRYSSPLAAQRWSWADLGAEAHTTMLDGTLRAAVGLSVMPLVSVSGVSRAVLGVAGTTSLSWSSGGRLTGEVRYGLERFDFAARQSARRLEQLSVLELRGGWKLR